MFMYLIFQHSSAKLPQLKRFDDSESTTTVAALLQQMENTMKANSYHDDDRNHIHFTSSSFRRTVNWTFENMRMLIGSDLPIFGDEQHPAVSLRLRYFDQRIVLCIN